MIYVLPNDIMRTTKRISIPDRSRPGLPTTATVPVVSRVPVEIVLLLGEGGEGDGEGESGGSGRGGRVEVWR